MVRALCRATIACARTRAVRLLAITAVTPKKNSAATFSGSAMVNVYSGGRKKKLYASTLAKLANNAGHNPYTTADTSTAVRKAIATLATPSLWCSRSAPPSDTATNTRLPR